LRIVRIISRRIMKVLRQGLILEMARYGRLA
jgi:hypothetical protein